jgi:ankyrin repeat protein
LHYAFLKGLTIITSIKNNYLTAYLNRPNMLELAKALLVRGANVNARIATPVQMFHSNCECGINAAGATPFLLAAGSGDVAAMRLLTAAGADPLLATKDNVTPLMAAAGIGRVDDPKDDEKKVELDAVKVAIEMGNNVNRTNAKGRTALHIVAYTGNDEIVKYLAEKGAQVNLRDKIGQTPWTIAEHIIPDSAIGAEKIHTAHKSTADLLLKLGATRLTMEDFPPSEAAAGTQPQAGPAGPE